MSKQLSESEIIKLSLLLYPEDMQKELKEDATVLMASVRERYAYRANGRYHKVMFGKIMALETLYKLGRFLNEEYPDGT